LALDGTTERRALPEPVCGMLLIAVATY